MMVVKKRKRQITTRQRSARLQSDDYRARVVSQDLRLFCPPSWRAGYTISITGSGSFLGVFVQTID
jgi:hypothetical protein